MAVLSNGLKTTTLHASKHPLCCVVGKIESLETPGFHAIIGSNYVRYDAETPLDHQMNMEPFSKNKLTLNNLDDRITFMYRIRVERCMSAVFLCAQMSD